MDVRTLMPGEPQAAKGRTSGISTPQQWLIDAWGGSQTDSGVTVNEYTALTSGAVHQAITIISNDVATLPMRLVYQDRTTDRVNRSHQAHRLMNLDAHEEISANRFRKVMMQNVLLHGNGIALIRRNDIGQAVSLTPVRTDKVRLYRSDGSTVIDGYVIGPGELYYEYYLEGQPHRFAWHEVFHITNTIGSSLWGDSTLAYMAEALGSSIAAEKFRQFQWKLNSRPSMVVYKRGQWDEQGRQDFVSKWDNRQRGWENSSRIAALPDTYKVDTLPGVTNEQNQLVEQWDKDVANIARFFNIPAYRLGININSNRANLEQQAIDYFQNTISPHIDTWKSEIRRKLLSYRDQERQTYEVVFDDEKLTMVDSATRTASYKSHIEMGTLSPNEVRDLEGRDAIDGGDFWMYNKNWGTYGPDEKEEPAPPALEEEVPEESEAKLTGPLTKRVYDARTASRRNGKAAD